MLAKKVFDLGEPIYLVHLNPLSLGQYDINRKIK